MLTPDRASWPRRRRGRQKRSADRSLASVWAREGMRIVVDANLGKFGQDARLADFLVRTGDQVLVEASPVDPVWGIGLSTDDPDAAHPARRRGLNLLGFALMEVRDMLTRRQRIDPTR